MYMFNRFPSFRSSVSPPVRPPNILSGSNSLKLIHHNFMKSWYKALTKSFQYLVVGCSCLIHLHILSYIVDDVPCICSQRWILAYITFFGYLLVYVFRNSFSVALVCMTKDDNIFITNNNSNYSNLTQGDCIQDIQKNINNENAEFDWDKTIRSGMLTAFFYGYIITQIPGGWLADRFGSKKVILIVMLISSISLLILPVCARTTYILVYAIRAVLGIALGMVSPSVTSMWGRWAPPLERSRLTTLPNVGKMVGVMAAFTTSGLLCAHGFDNGWGSIFYISGGLTLIWLIAWAFLTTDSPDNHPRIQENERNYIASNLGYKSSKKSSFSVPWRQVFTSRAVWACIIGHVCFNWTDYTLPHQSSCNGALSSVPYIFNATTTFIAGYTADVIRSKHLLNTTRTRKVYQATDRYVAVILLTLGSGFSGLCQAGVFSNHVDFAPKYAGVIYGITNMAATIPGLIAPIVAGILTSNGTQEEWREVFFVCAGFGVFGSLIFGLFASGELEDWSKDSKTKMCELKINTDVFMSKASSLNCYESGIQHTNNGALENSSTDSIDTRL
ncbi:hypothetical protein KUTeg_014657 [Tegillarca granosa]|uniref:Major facilitator superfamily (MFS) profile domain-containing protein n=2 Tax=Tegillarca granosa TaxID=220873 RepID=A0ABQ9ERE5_TEGGR|nr:hypothetical protein KUTeg_014657 [Tegillarca granosa]